MSGVDGQGRPGDTVGVTAEDRDTARTLWRVLGRDEMAKATPEQLLTFMRACPEPVGLELADRMLRAADEAHRCWEHDHDVQIAELHRLRLAFAELGQRLTQAEQRARERAAEVVTRALRILDNYGQGGTYAADYIRALAADDRTGQR